MSEWISGILAGMEAMLSVAVSQVLPRRSSAVLLALHVSDCTLTKRWLSLQSVKVKVEVLRHHPLL
jgi:hypothetical protein